ncbi:MAG: exodeoxyribonuclease VII large subunit [Planctomycetia bacterium]|jgi:exodeoxyribonuclease VII large subunit
MQPPIQTVSQLTAQIKDLLETTFPSVWVTGELSDFARPRSGHCYFTLKDDQAQIRGVIWRGVASRLPFEPSDGLEVICRGHLDLYAPRGSYQLIVDQIEPKGVGALELALRQLRQKLAAEGLFEPARKKQLPSFIRRVAVVTSQTGAAIRDFLEVLRRRWQGVEVMIVPVRVQGEEASREIALAIETVNRLATPIDCIVVTRGGGSLEDLWAFNEERTVRAVAASRLPVVSAIGHEIDVTLVDLAADVRAATPSEAAELVAPAAEEWAARLDQFRARLQTGLRGRAAMARNQLDVLANSRPFRRPVDRLHDLARTLDDLDVRSGRAVRRQIDLARRGLDSTTAQLESLSPLSILSRGYSLTQRGQEGTLIYDASTLTSGEEIVTRFDRGRAVSRVEWIETEE